MRFSVNDPDALAFGRAFYTELAGAQGRRSRFPRPEKPDEGEFAPLGGGCACTLHLAGRTARDGICRDHRTPNIDEHSLRWM